VPVEEPSTASEADQEARTKESGASEWHDSSLPALARFGLSTRNRTACALRPRHAEKTSWARLAPSSTGPGPCRFRRHRRSAFLPSSLPAP